MSLAQITAELEAQWNRSVRQHHPTQRWAETDPAIPADPGALRRQLNNCYNPDGRALLARLVKLAAAGNDDAALAATLTVLTRIVRWEPPPHLARCSTTAIEHDALAAAVWEAIVTERRPERPFLRERVEQIAWHTVKKPVLRSQREIAAADPEQLIGSGAARPGTRRHRRGHGHRPSADEIFTNEVVATATIDTLLDQLTAEGRLTAIARCIVENLAAGGDGRRNDPNRGPRAAATERLRIVTRLRSDPRVRQALLAA
jgi:hypothetical protein